MPEAQIVSTDEMRRYVPFSGNYRYRRDTFWLAGQDSYTQPPAQDPDLFIAFTNIMPVMRGTLDRRWGYQRFSTGNVSNLNYLRLAAYRNDTSNARRIAAVAAGNTSGQIDIFNEDGSLHDSNIGGLSVVPLTQGVIPQVVNSRDYLYLLYPRPSAAPSQPVQVVRRPTAFTNPDATLGGVAFQLPAQAYDNNTVTAALGGNGSTMVSQITPGTNSSCTWSGFAAIAGTITSIVLHVLSGAVDSTAEQTGTAAVEYSLNGGTTWSFIYNNHNHTDPNGFAINDAVTLSTGQDLTQIKIRASGSNPAGNHGTQGIAIYEIYINVTYTPGSSTIGTYSKYDDNTVTAWGSLAPPGTISLGALAGGTITLSVGRQYTGVYRNSSSGGITSLINFSASTGPITSQQQPLTLPGALNDPQYDFFDILATADGGDQTTLYLVTSVAAGTTSYTDNTPETTLLNNTIYQQLDANGNPIGCYNNIAPGAGSNPFLAIKHRGRLFLADKHTVFFSKNLAEITTTGSGGVPFVAGRWEECFPPTYAFDASEWAETNSALLSDGVVLYIATEKNVRRLIGDGPQNFQKPEVLFNEVGVLNQEVWQRVFREGQPLGAMWLTPDNRVIFSDMNTYHDVGHPIQDVLNTINKTFISAPSGVASVYGTVASQTARAMFASSGSYDLYLLAIATGANTLPDTLLVYNLRTSRWAVWKPADLTTAMLFNIDANGNPQFLFAAGNLTTPPLYQYLSTLKQDRVNNTPVAIPITLQTSWLNLGDGQLRKAVNLITSISEDPTNLLVSLDGARTGSEFVSPISILTNASTVLSPLGDLNVNLAGLATKYQWYRLKLTDSGTTQTDVILGSLSWEVVPIHRVT